jgi:hypothetical protein
MLYMKPHEETIGALEDRFGSHHLAIELTGKTNPR